MVAVQGAVCQKNANSVYSFLMSIATFELLFTTIELASQLCIDDSTRDAFSEELTPLAMLIRATSTEAGLEFTRNPKMENIRLAAGGPRMHNMQQHHSQQEDELDVRQGYHSIC
jgi:hypothetical protein